MGLDMYLETNSKPLAMAICREANTCAMEIGDEGLRKLELDINKSRAERGHVFYWRKANQIHNWFVNEVQGGEDRCNLYEVVLADLEALLDVIKRVLADHSLAEELLPTLSGFFFGSTEYDEYYWMDLEETKKMIEFILSKLEVKETEYGFRYAVHPDEPDWQVRFYYRASW